MAFVGVERFIYFYVLNAGTPVTGLVKSNFTIIFTRSNITSPDTLSITEIGAGRYYASYIPTTVGTDYIEIDASTYSLQVINTEPVYDTSTFTGGSSAITVNQNYPTTNALKVTQVSSPATYTLYIYFYTDWQIGNQATNYSVGQTGLNSDGTWINNIVVVPGVYNIVINNGSTSVVISSNLSIT
jgi:hypothetical protein